MFAFAFKCVRDLDLIYFDNYMFAEFDYDKLPIVRVTFNGRIQNASDFDDFINNWRELYNKQENFIFIFVI